MASGSAKAAPAAATPTTLYAGGPPNGSIGVACIIVTNRGPAIAKVRIAIGGATDYISYDASVIPGTPLVWGGRIISPGESIVYQDDKGTCNVRAEWLERLA